MPNWANNRLIVKGGAAALDGFLKAAAGEIDGEATPLSFESLLPTPRGLLENGGWYDWRCEHWGVKWELEEPADMRRGAEQLVFWFASTWTGPVPLVRAVAERFPTLTFELVYADQTAAHAGIALFRGGLCAQDEAVDLNEDEALDLLLRHWPAEARGWQKVVEELKEEEEFQTAFELLDSAATGA